MEKKGILIAIDGVDSSGKQTQTELLCKKLAENGINVRHISFPDYDSESSALVKMYLNGDFGSKAEDVSAYAASVFFAADRFASYRTDWKTDLENGAVIIADRYVSSNMIHQAGKITDKAQKREFLEWLDDLEYNKLGLPRPDCVFFLDMPVDFAKQLMEKRANKITGEENKDIHERDTAYLERSYENAVDVAKASGWKRIRCVSGESVRTVEDINGEIYDIVSQFLKNK